MSTLISSTWKTKPAEFPIDGAGRFGSRRHAFPLLLLAPLFGALAYRLWGAWPDPLVDFGRELYVPWRMIEGDTLYRDIAYFNGPLSPAINAILFRCFGASLHTLVIANHVFLVLTSWLAYCNLRRISNSATATLGVAGFLALFAFAQYLPIRNYNYISPYSHEMTHGLMLALLALNMIWRLPQIGSWAAFVTGLLLGLAALTKVEIAVAACASVIASAALTCRLDQSPWKRLARTVGCLVVGAALPLAIAVLWFAQSMTASDALSGCFGAWQMAAADEIRNLDFYRRGMGTLDIWASLRAMAVSCSRWAVLLAAGVALGTSPKRATRHWTTCLAGAAVAVALWIGGFDWSAMERGLPVIVGAALAWRLFTYFRNDVKRRAATHSPDSRLGPGWPAACVDESCRVGWCVLALALLAKMLLFGRISHYGFVLAAPAALTVVALIYAWIPAALTIRGRWGGALPWFTTPILLAYVAAYQCEQASQTHRTIEVGYGGDRFEAGEGAAPVVAALEHIKLHIAPDETLAVLPEGVILNYLTRRRTSVPYITWMPPEVIHFGETNMLEALRQSPPDWVIVAQRDLREYGVPQFGEGFVDGISQWVADHYRVVEKWDDGRWRLLRSYPRDVVGDAPAIGAVN